MFTVVGDRAILEKASEAFSMSIIQTNKLTKCYGKIRGIEDFSLNVNEGEIFGFLGPNGSGKSTTIRTLLHLMQPTSGEATIFGKDVQKEYRAILDDIGYLPGDAELYGNMTAEQLIRFASSFRADTGDDAFTHELVERLGCTMRQPCKTLSKGNKQKIAILLALFHEPKLLILDEPTNGLDPLTQIELYKILRDMKARGTTVFFSSHNLPEVEKICDRVAIVKEGKLMTIETIEELRRKRKKIVSITFAGETDKNTFDSIDGIEIETTNHATLRLHAGIEAIEPLLRELAKHRVVDITIAYPSLEEVFMRYY